MKIVKGIMWGILKNVPLFLMQFVGMPMVIILIVVKKVHGKRGLEAERK